MVVQLQEAAYITKQVQSTKHDCCDTLSGEEACLAGKQDSRVMHV